MRIVCLLVFLLVNLLGVTACDSVYGHYSKFQRHSKQYVTAQNGNNLLVPPPLSDDEIAKNYYISPGVGEKGTTLLPPGSLAEKMITDKTAYREAKKAQKHSR